MHYYYSLSSSASCPEIDSAEVIKILIASDCHLGFEETDPVIGEDSFITFEEVLTKAVDTDVDMILLGGDLFHHNNPSQKTMNKCIQLLREYTLGTRNSRLELLSKARDVFSNCITQTANFLDENIRVSIPVFSVHGNHDDPSGIGQQSSMDTLSSAGLVNYFGKCTDLTDIKINPIIIRKGATHLAIYGLGHINDDRLCRLFMTKKVKFIEPDEWPENCLRILVLHQNRADRGPKRFISESFIPSFLDLVIWGHEHDCRIEPEENFEREFFVVQPGSTVATSLCEGEAKPKHIGVLQLWKDLWSFRPIKLNTVRPFIWKSIPLSNVVTSNDSPQAKSEKIKEYCRMKVEEMIQEANTLATGHPKQPKLPLIRLRCEYTDESQLFNVVKFGQQFLGRVATPNLEIVRFKKLMTSAKSSTVSDRIGVMNDLKELYGTGYGENQNFSECINRIVKDYFSEHAEASLTVLNLKELEEAVEKFMEKGETDCFNQAIDRKLKTITAKLLSYGCDDEEGIERELEKLKEENILTKNTSNEIKEKLGDIRSSKIVEDSDSDTDEYEPEKKLSPPLIHQENTRTKANVKDRESLDGAQGTSQVQSDSFSEESSVKRITGRGRGGSRARGRVRGRGAKDTSRIVFM